MSKPEAQAQIWVKAGAELTQAKQKLAEAITAIAPLAADEKSRAVLTSLTDLLANADNLLGWMNEQQTGPADPPA